MSYRTITVLWQQTLPKVLPWLLDVVQVGNCSHWLCVSGETIKQKMKPLLKSQNKNEICKCLPLNIQNNAMTFYTTDHDTANKVILEVQTRKWWQSHQFPFLRKVWKITAFVISQVSNLFSLHNFLYFTVKTVQCNNLCNNNNYTQIIIIWKIKGKVTQLD